MQPCQANENVQIILSLYSTAFGDSTAIDGNRDGEDGEAAKDVGDGQLCSGVVPRQMLQGMCRMNGRYNLGVFPMA